MTPRKRIETIYLTLLKTYGPQGWWPISFRRDRSGKHEGDGGYHPGDYRYPHHDSQKLEICIGAVLTQNTNWNNVLSALASLAGTGAISLNGLLEAEKEQLALAIKSAGYYNQKARYLRNLARFLQKYSFEKLERLPRESVRDLLLNVKGIGPETADCILLYALKKSSFVVDTYTKRILSRLGIISSNPDYDSVQRLFESSLANDLHLFQEYHALLVRHGKKFYRKKPYGDQDRLLVP
ncbi:MAG: endonuclease III domain-containing protein [Proteobacteria bacterium]|nr:endonuclease III domain-containing protein [Pseudomonadota bacterium]